MGKPITRQCEWGSWCYSCWPCSVYSKHDLLLDQPGYDLFWRCRVAMGCSTLSDPLFKLNWCGLIMHMLPPVVTVWYLCSRCLFWQCMWSLVPYVTEGEQPCPFPRPWLHFDRQKDVTAEIQLWQIFACNNTRLVLLLSYFKKDSLK